MSYSDAAYIISSQTMPAPQLVELVTPAGTSPWPEADDPDVVAAVAGACAKADALIDDALRVVWRGTLPLSSPPEGVRSASAKLACYALWEQRPTDPDENPYREAKKDALAYLADIAAGRKKLDLSDEPGGSSAVPSYDSARGLSASDRRFTPDRLKELL